MTQFYKLNLTELLNHKHVNHKVEGIVEDRLEDTMPEAYRTVPFDERFKPECLPGINQEYELLGIPFVFTGISKEGYDNVCFESQSLEVAANRSAANKYCKIHLIGFCESVDFSETISLLDAQGAEEKVEVFFYNYWKGIESWDYDRPSKICKVAGPVTTMNEGPRALFCCSVPFQKSMEICQINLPFNPNMHVFSITLEDSGGNC